MNKIKILKHDKCAFFMCDLQEKFRNPIVSFDLVIKTAQRMINISNTLSIPLLVTEQYPKGLGKTVEELNINNAKIIEEKTEFTMLSDKILKFLEANSIESVIIFGIEAHVCVYQTCLGLLSIGIDVHLLVDGISCRNIHDGIIAIKQLQFMGVILSTSESIAFQLIRDKNHTKFKEIQSLIKDIIPATDLMKNLR